MNGATNGISTATSDQILVIDDDPDILDLVKNNLEGEGHAVLVTAKPNEGINLYERHWRTIKLVLLDFLMPDMMGDVVFECLQQIHPDVPVILMTGCDDIMMGENMLESGIRGCLHKPFVAADLISQVREAIAAED